jgi:hypothetical protein
MKLRRLQLLFLLTPLLVMVCSSGAMILHFTDGSGVVCDPLDWNNEMYSCEIPCPSGTHTVTLRQWPDSSTQNHDLASFCPNMPRAATAVSTATVPPTATSIPTQTATTAAQPTLQAIAPLLTGDVTACSLNAGFINFTLAAGAPDLTGDQVTVAINGTQVRCTLPLSNQTVLSCALPDGVTFPAQVSVAQGGQTADQFSYSGAACFYAAPTNTPRNPGNSGPTSTPCLGDQC